MSISIPDRFRPALERIKALAQDDRYRGAFIFGSVARGETTEASDLDIKVVTDADNACPNINHPFLGGVKLDLTFMSLAQLQQKVPQERAAGRIPMLAESIIIFDKDGELVKLKAQPNFAERAKCPESRHQFLQFVIFHHDNKVRQNLQKDPDTALLTMTVCLNELLKFHYEIQARWIVSSKRLLRDLGGWDPKLASLVREFVRTAELNEKFRLWTAIVDHVLKPLGGRQPIEENNCTCATCTADLKNLLG